jgi:5-methylcytosine-specific restriction protein B
LKKVNAEFGYRTVNEISRYLHFNDEDENGLKGDEAIDTAVLQKLLPKLHGSRKKLEPVLKQLWKICFTGTDKDLIIAEENVPKAIYPESADKIRRMYESAMANGFTSFAEA